MSRMHSRDGMRRLVTAIAVAMSALLGIAGTSVPSSGAATPVPQHYLCYQAAAKSGFTVPAGIRLVNSLAPNGFVPYSGPGECALQSGAQSRARRPVPDHESDVALSGLGHHGGAARGDRHRNESIFDRHSRHQVADRALGAVMEEPGPGHRTSNPRLPPARITTRVIRSATWWEPRNSVRPRPSWFVTSSGRR